MFFHPSHIFNNIQKEKKHKHSNSYVVFLLFITKLFRTFYYFVLSPPQLSDVSFAISLRKIIDNVRGELEKRQWIIFDGDVDPEWVENLNSLLDNTKLLTLPNGERLSIPPNVRIMFEVGTYAARRGQHVTLAPV